MATNETKDTQNFDEYRRQMHPEEEKGRSVVPEASKPVRVAFGIFMIIVYVGVGILLITNFFNWESSWAWARIFIGVLLIIYGIFRGYRQYKGESYYSK